MGVENVNSNQTQVNFDQMQGTGVVPETVAEEAAAEVVPLLSESGNLSVGEMRETDKAGETEPVGESGDVPVLDEADRALLERLCVDLEALIAKLQADTTEAQIQSSKDRIESLQGQLKQQHEESMAKINESLEELKDQYQAQLAQKILGWLGVIFAVAMAALTVVTCGGAAAVFAVVGAVIAVGLQICNETGATEELAKLIADSLRESGMSKQEADAAAQLIVAFLSLALSLVGVVGSSACAWKAMKDVAAGVVKASKALVDVSMKVQKGIQIGVAVASGVMAGVSLGTGTASAIINFKVSETQAEVTELQAILKKLQAILADEEDDLKVLLEQLMNSMAAIAELLQSKQDTLKEISMNIGA